MHTQRNIIHGCKAYKSELEKVVISDEDIEHLPNTVSRILEIIKEFQIEKAEPM